VSPTVEGHANVWSDSVGCPTLRHPLRSGGLHTGQRIARPGPVRSAALPNDFAAM
jgi:hypothetical protein